MERHENDVVSLPHQLIMQDRARLELTGVLEVDNFDENIVQCSTSLGNLFIHGKDLNVFRLDMDGTSLSIEGRIESIVYTDVKKGGLFGRLLR